MSTAEFTRAQQRMLEAHGVRAETRFVDVPAIDGSAQVLVAGDGPPVMMVIGGGVPAAMWAPLMARLDGCRLHVVDLPSHGGTDRGSFSTDRIRPMMTAFLREVMTGIGLERAAFVSQSMGSLFTIWLALAEPERVRSMTVIACPSFLLDTSAPLPFRLLSVPPVGRLITRLQPPSAKQVERLGRMAAEDMAGHPELRDLLLALERIPYFYDDFIQLLHSCLTLTGARPEVRLTAEQIARINVPVQLVWGDRDTFGPPSVGGRAAEIIPDARMHTVPGGHAPWWDSPAEIAALVNPFLAEHAESRSRRATGHD